MGAPPSPGMALGDYAPALRAAHADRFAGVLELSKLIIFCLVLTRGFPLFIENIFVSFLQTFHLPLPNTISLVGY